MALTQVQSGMLNSDSQNYGFKNRISNGDMRIAQRGTSAFTQTTSTTYCVDRWATYGSGGSQFTAQQLSSNPPAGYKNYLGIVNSASPVTPSSVQEWDVFQYIEGYNIADLGWGAAGASSVTLSFWVRSSVTGSFGASICNYNSTRTYPFSYTIASANTWEQKTITIPGDTSGTWYSDNAIGMGVLFSMGSGSTKSGTANTWAGVNYTQPTGSVALVATASATWQVTGVQLEKGSTATQFDYRQYGTELALCQRYYSKSYPQATVPGTSSHVLGAVTLFTSSTSSGYMVGNSPFPVVMRTNPTVTVYGCGGTAGTVTQGDTTSTLTGAAANQVGDRAFSLQNTSGGTWTPNGNLIYMNWSATAEL